MRTDNRPPLGKLAGDILDHFTAEREKSARLQAERDALALRVVGLKEALEKAKKYLPEDTSSRHNWSECTCQDCERIRDVDDVETALAAPESDAEARVKEWREDSKRLDWIDEALKASSEELRFSLAPAGNLSVRQVIVLGREIKGVRHQIDALRVAQKWGSDAK